MSGASVARSTTPAIPKDHLVANLIPSATTATESATSPASADQDAGPGLAQESAVSATLALDPLLAVVIVIAVAVAATTVTTADAHLTAGDAALAVTALTVVMIDAGMIAMIDATIEEDPQPTGRHPAVVMIIGNLAEPSTKSAVPSAAVTLNLAAPPTSTVAEAPLPMKAADDLIPEATHKLKTGVQSMTTPRAPPAVTTSALRTTSAKSITLLRF